MKIERCDALVLGAGPAGSTAAALLAESGHEVVVLERERFPRYRVGESLIPHCWFPLHRLGLVERLDASGFVVRKHSVQFVSTDGERARPFYFARHSDHPSSRTWQVARGPFDSMLVENAIEKGARVEHGAAARELLHDGQAVRGVRAAWCDGGERELHAPITIDATGRDAFAQSRLRWRVPDADLRKFAIWTYYRGALRDPGIDEGATTIAYLPEKGWFWYIPQSEDRVSVGVVAERDYLYRGTRDPASIFEREVGLQPWIERHLACGRQTGEHFVTSDFSYRARHCACDGLVLVGDAFAFLDPVFSSGVYLALQSGALAADAAHEALAAGDAAAVRFAAYGERMRREIENMRRLVHAFYDPAFRFSTFLKAHPDLGDDVTDCLIGNLDRDFHALFTTMKAYAAIPEPLAHGGPLA